MKSWMIRILAVALLLGYPIYLYMSYTGIITGKVAGNIRDALVLLSTIIFILHAKWGGGWKGDSDE
ncbi:MAG: hypothetical protein COA81_13405 [Alphaproteobacteria bacterium]|nr:MAG: hypothetical protein COA81_13405 [Alphaproteobacteria bacterium]